MSIDQLVQAARRGDSNAFGELVRRVERAALSVAYSVTTDFSASGDVVQDSFLQAWRHLAELQDVANFEAWLMQLVRRRAIDHLRANAKSASTMSLDASANVAASETESLETNRDIELAMRGLDEISRQAIAMRYFENCSSREIGQKLGLSSGAVDMRLHRAREHLRVKLTELAGR